MNQNDLKKIEESAKEFFEKMTIPVSKMEVNSSSEEGKEMVSLEVKLEEPQILIGQGGQTLFELQRLLRTMLNKKMQNIFYLNLDINDYKKKKVEYLKDMAKELADQVSLTKEEKILIPMPAYERRVIHSELAQRSDIVTESQGQGFDRHVVIKPRSSL